MRLETIERPPGFNSQGWDMNDETKAAVEWLREIVRISKRDGQSVNYTHEEALLAHIEGEPARLAAALEELREACAQWLQSDEATWDSAHELGDVVRMAPLTATPLADRIAELEAARVRDIETATLKQRDLGAANITYALRCAEYAEARAEKAEARAAELESEVARRDALIKSDGYEEMRQHAQELAVCAEKAEAQLAEARERLDEFGSHPTVADGIQAMRLRMLEYHTRVEKAESRAKELEEGNNIRRQVRLEAQRDEAIAALRGLVSAESALLTRGEDSEPFAFAKAWKVACAVLARLAEPTDPSKEKP